MTPLRPVRRPVTHGRSALCTRYRLCPLCITDYAEAPHQLQPGDSVFADESSTPGPKYTWWRTNPPVPTGQYTGLLDSLQTIQALCTSAPQAYSGLLGFSQGASFTSLLLQLRQLWLAAQRDSKAMIDMGPASWRDNAVMRDVCSIDYSFLSSIRFALLFSAFVPRDPTLRASLFLSGQYAIGRSDDGEPGKLSTLHVMGEQDRVIAIELSRELVSCFAGGKQADEGDKEGGGSVVEVLVHPTGHHVPSDAAHRKKYVEFIQRQAASAASAGENGHAAESGEVSDDENGETNHKIDT